MKKSFELLNKGFSQSSISSGGSGQMIKLQYPHLHVLNPTFTHKFSWGGSHESFWIWLPGNKAYDFDPKQMSLSHKSSHLCF